MSLANKKAALVCALFGLTGIFGWLLTRHEDATTAFLLLTYYGLLVLGTYFSIRTFSPITPTDILQSIFDGTLVLIYVTLAFSFGFPFQFAVVSAALFLISTVKYLHLRHIVTEPSALLTRKIRLNSLAALLSGVAGYIALVASPLAAAWTLCIVFAIAQWYLLIINPMHK